MNNKSEPVIFPQSLQKYQSIIEKTIKQTILISKTNTLSTSRTQSKFGGIPYFPLDYPIYDKVPWFCENWTPWPKSLTTGKELCLLIQINFEEMPHIEPFPKKEYYNCLLMIIIGMIWNTIIIAFIMKI